MHDKEQFSESGTGEYGDVVSQITGIFDASNYKYYGKTPMQIINEIRINFAKKQLEMTNYSVTDTAFEASYSNPSLFIKTFKKLRPLRLRAIVRNSLNLISKSLYLTIHISVLLLDLFMSGRDVRYQYSVLKGEIMSQKLKVVTIGGETLCPELLEGFIKRYHELPVSELWLVDVEGGKAKLDIIFNLCQRMIDNADVPMKLYKTLDRREALKMLISLLPNCA